MLHLVIYLQCALQQITNVMAALENTFRNSYCKGDGSVPNHTPEVAALHTSALLAWMLLVSGLPVCHMRSELIDS
jgi:Interferon-related developmental regulator (IFRD)